MSNLPPAGHQPDEFDDGMTMAGADIGAIPPPPSVDAVGAGSAAVPDEYDDGRTIAGAELSDLPPPPSTGGATGEQQDRALAHVTASNFFIRLRRSDIAGDGETIEGREVITIGSGNDQVLCIEHELMDEVHGLIAFRNGRFELSSVGDRSILHNGKPLAGKVLLCREDRILFEGEGGPCLCVDMLYPDADRSSSGGLNLELLDPLMPVLQPLSELTRLEPVVVAVLLALVVFGGLGSCFLSMILLLFV